MVTIMEGTTLEVEVTSQRCPRSAGHAVCDRLMEGQSGSRRLRWLCARWWQTQSLASSVSLGGLAFWFPAGLAPWGKTGEWGLLFLRGGSLAGCLPSALSFQRGSHAPCPCAAASPTPSGQVPRGSSSTAGTWTLPRPAPWVPPALGYVAAGSCRLAGRCCPSSVLQNRRNTYTCVINPLY